MTVPYSFANATVSIPLSQLDANFNTPITLGNTAIQLGNTVTTLNNMTLANVTISSGNVTITNVSVTTANVTTLNAATVIATTANVTTANITTGNVTTANIVTANITTGNVTNMSSGNVAITGGSINGTTLGASTASTANVTTLTTSSTVTINGGTANGVAYLNGSKVLTTGSALSFDGTRFGVNGGLVADNNLVAQINSPASSAKFMGFNRDGGYGLLIGYDLGGVDYATIRTVGNYPISFGINNAEAMRLTSTGLGIGTSSPNLKLQVVGQVGFGTGTAAGSNGSGLAIYASDFPRLTMRNSTTGDTTSDGLQIYMVGNDVSYNLLESGYQRWFTNNTEAMRLDASGNLGLGVTPSAWNSAYKAIQVGTSASIWGASNAAYLALNAYQDGTGTNRYLNSNFAVLYGSDGNGGFQWRTAPSGTAGNAISFTQAMTLDASGNLGLGATSISPLGTSYTTQAVQGANGAGFRLYQSTNERGRFYADSTAAFVQSVTSIPLVFSTDNTERARITSGGDLLVGTTALLANGNYFAYSPGNTWGVFAHDNGVASGTEYIKFYYNNGQIGSITQNGTTAVAYNTSSDYRLKDNPQPLTGSGAFIDALKPKTWAWKADGSKGVGFIAHEVQEVSPGSVTGEKDGEQMQTMEYGSAEFIANIIAELQSLRARVAQLEAK